MPTESSAVIEKPLLLEPQKREALLASYPKSPGVYQFKNQKGEIIYIGKANSLPARLRQYFQNPHRLDNLIEEIYSIEVISCSTEREALALECTLIKRFSPRYNIRLKDDKNYLYVFLPEPSSESPTNPSSYPKLEIVRRQTKRPGSLFGPYPNSTALKEVLTLLETLLPLRRCQDRDIKNARPCFYYTLGRCAGPCAKAMTPSEYKERLRAFAEIFRGNDKPLRKNLLLKMQKEASNLAFESAARTKSQILSLDKLNERQQVVLSRNRIAEDYLGLAKKGNLSLITVLSVREGKVIETTNHLLTLGKLHEAPDSLEATLISCFISQYYALSTSLPKRILINTPLEDTLLLEEFLTNLKQSRVELIVPKRNQRKSLLLQANKTAQLNLDSYLAESLQDNKNAQNLLLELQKALSLPSLPLRLECYDISNTMGQNSVGSMVVFREGHPSPKDYRHFIIKTVVGPDDFASMQEVLRRRFAHLDPTSSQEGFSKAPDLIIIDGGKGQLSAAQEILKEKNLFIPIYGLAKREEELFYPDSPTPIILERESPLLFLVQRLRDEAHRFAITHHRALRAKKALHSKLEDIPGIGPVRRRALILRFGDIQGIKDASVDELILVKGLTLPTIQLLKELL